MLLCVVRTRTVGRGRSQDAKERADGRGAVLGGLRNVTTQAGLFQPQSNVLVEKGGCGAGVGMNEGK